MKALRTVGRALLVALFLATVTLGGGLLMMLLTLTRSRGQLCDATLRQRTARRGAPY